MTKADVRSALLELPASERVEVIEDAWESLAGDRERWPLTGEQRELLAERRADAEAHPEDTVSWAEARAQIEAER